MGPTLNNTFHENGGTNKNNSSIMIHPGQLLDDFDFDIDLLFDNEPAELPAAPAPAPTTTRAQHPATTLGSSSSATSFSKPPLPPTIEAEDLEPLPIQDMGNCGRSPSSLVDGPCLSLPRSSYYMSPSTGIGNERAMTHSAPSALRIEPHYFESSWRNEKRTSIAESPFPREQLPVESGGKVDTHFFSLLGGDGQAVSSSSLQSRPTNKLASCGTMDDGTRNSNTKASSPSGSPSILKTRTSPTGPMVSNHRATKKPKTVQHQDEKRLFAETQRDENENYDSSSLLHRACRAPNVTVHEIARLLQTDPEAALRPVSLDTDKLVYKPRLEAVVKETTKERYSYPLHLAIKYNAGHDVLTALLDAAPEVLHRKDGGNGWRRGKNQEETSLAVLIRHRPRDAHKLLGPMILKAPMSVYVKDRHDNTLLHLACMVGSSIQVMRLLVIAYPEALHQRNIHGKLPVEICQQRIAFCGDQVADFVKRAHYESLTRRRRCRLLLQQKQHSASSPPPQPQSRQHRRLIPG